MTAKQIFQLAYERQMEIWTQSREAGPEEFQKLLLILIDAEERGIALK